MRKSGLDRDTAAELDEPIDDVSLTTQVFLRKLMQALAHGEEVTLPGFGKFKLLEWAPSQRLSGKEIVNGPCFRVSFIKARAFGEFIKANQEKLHGKTRRRRISRPGKARKGSR